MSFRGCRREVRLGDGVGRKLSTVSVLKEGMGDMITYVDVSIDDFVGVGLSDLDAVYSCGCVRHCVVSGLG
jgi:hypothetical protein